MRRNTAAEVMLQLAPMLSPGLPEPLAVSIRWDYDDPEKVWGDSRWWGEVHASAADFAAWLVAFGIDADVTMTRERKDGWVERSATKGAVRVFCLESSES
jgi:hypothetical protein